MKNTTKILTVAILIAVLVGANQMIAQSWTYIGSPQIAKNVKDITVNNTGNIVYIAENDYLLKSTNGGTIWRATSEVVSNPLVVVCKEDNANIVVVAGQNFMRYSTNGGTSFTSFGEPLTTNLTPLRLAVSPVNTSNMFLGRKYVNDPNHRSMWRSDQSGASWAPCDNFTWATDVYDIAPYPVSGVGRDNELWVCGSDPSGQSKYPPRSTMAVASTSGIWFSTNAGSNWQAKTMGDYNLRSLVVIHKSNNPYLITVTENGEIFRSTNYGVDWINVYTTNSIGRMIRVNRYTTPNTVLLATSNGVYRSLDEGATWSQSNNGLGNDLNVQSISIVPNSNTIFAGTDNSIYKSTDNGNSWVNVGKMRVSSINGKANDVYAVTVDNAYVARYSNGYYSNLYIESAGNNFGSSSILYHPDNILLIPGVKNDTAYLYRSINYGNNFEQIFSLTSNNSKFNGVINHPVWKEFIYLFGAGVYNNQFSNIFLSTNTGNNWGALHNVGSGSNFVTDLSISSDQGIILYVLLNDETLYRRRELFSQINSNVKCVASHINNESIVYAGKSDGLQRSTDFGQNWNPLLSNRYIKKIITVPVNNNKLNHTIVLYTSGLSDTIVVIKDSAQTYSFLRYMTGNLSQRIRNIYGSSVEPILYSETDDGIFKIDLPYKPVKIEPLSYTQLTTTNITFRWNSVVGADSFTMQLSTNINFSNPTTIHLKDTVRILTLAYWQKYYWRVAAKNSYYNKTSEWSNIDSFYVIQPGSGCPFVYTWNGNEYIEDNNILPQSEYLLDGESKEKDYVIDYYQLFTTPVLENNTYKLRVAENEQERSILDQLKLIIVDHDPSVSISVNEYGEIIQYAKPATIINAQLEKEDVHKYISEQDNNYVEANKNETLHLTFDSPQDLNERGLLINAILRPIPPDPPAKKLIAGKIYQNIEGKLVNTSQFRLRRNPSYIWIPITGGVSKEGGIGFDITWEQAVSIDYVELSHSLEASFTINTCEMLSAVHSGSEDVTDVLQESDNNIAELYPGEYIDLVFEAPPLAEGKKRSFIFVSNGRYDRIEKFNEGITLRKQKSMQEKEIPKEYSLTQNRPNPFNPVTTISYALPEPGFIILKVYDVLGREVAELVNEFKEAGYYDISWDASSQPSGVYFYKLQAGNFTSVKKMLLMK